MKDNSYSDVMDKNNTKEEIDTFIASLKKAVMMLS